MRVHSWVRTQAFVSRHTPASNIHRVTRQGFSSCLTLVYSSLTHLTSAVTDTET